MPATLPAPSSLGQPGIFVDSGAADLAKQFDFGAVRRLPNGGLFVPPNQEAGGDVEPRVNEKRRLSVAEAAERLGLAPWTVRELIHAGDLVARRKTKRSVVSPWIVCGDSVDEYLAGV